MIQAYYKENAKFKEEQELKVSNYHAEMIVMKLARHFKLPIRYVQFYGYCQSGRASNWGGRIRLSHNSSILLICHEVNHFLCWKKYGTGKGKARHGTKKWYSQLKRVLNYAKKKNYWQEEYDRRTVPKPVKPEPTKIELRLQRIALLEDRIKKWNSKIKFYNNKIKKANRSISGLKKHI